MMMDTNVLNLAKVGLIMKFILAKSHLRSLGGK